MTPEPATPQTLTPQTLTPKTVVAFHAHPDDEALLSGGTLALLSAAGHRVVLIVATSGSAGLAAQQSLESLSQRRVAEVEASAQVLGCARVVHLGFADSGWSDSGRGAVPAESFAGTDVAVPAERLAEVLREESPDVLMIYDRNGGYGHADHVRVHAAGVLAAKLADVPRVMQVTIDRTRLSKALRLLAAVRLVPENTATDRLNHWFSSSAEITHQISVKSVADRKRLALACHQSQTEGGRKLRTIAILLALPRPIFRKVCGTEWFVEMGVRCPPTPLTDFFDTAGLRSEVTS